MESERRGGEGEGEGDNFDSQGDNIWGLKIITDIWNKIHILFYFLRRKLLCLIFCWFWSKQFLLNSAKNLGIKSKFYPRISIITQPPHLHCSLHPGEGAEVQRPGAGGQTGCGFMFWSAIRHLITELLSSNSSLPGTFPLSLVGGFPAPMLLRGLAGVTCGTRYNCFYFSFSLSSQLIINVELLPLPV